MKIAFSASEPHFKLRTLIIHQSLGIITHWCILRFDFVSSIWLFFYKQQNQKWSKLTTRLRFPPLISGQAVIKHIFIPLNRDNVALLTHKQPKLSLCVWGQFWAELPFGFRFFILCHFGA
jgi:hypothetical protein